MALPLPDALLSRNNKVLREKCEQVLAEVRRYQAVTRLERETLRAAETKTAQAKERLANLQRAEERLRSAAQGESEELTKAEAESGKLQQILQKSRVEARDVLDRVTAAAKRIDAVHAKIQDAETQSSALEQQVMNWVEENKVAAQAEGGATDIFGNQAKRVEALHKEAAQIAIKNRQLEAELADELSIYDSVIAELQRCRGEAADGQQEIQKLRKEIADAADVASDAADRANAAQQLDDLRRSCYDRRRDADVARHDMQIAENDVERTQNKIYALESKRSRVLLRLKEVQKDAGEAERQLHFLEVQAGLTSSGNSDTVRRIEALREELEEARKRAASMEPKLVLLRDILRTAEDEASSLAAIEQAYSRMGDAHVAEVASLSAALDLGMQRLQRHLLRHAEVCQTTSEQNEKVMLLQSAVRRTRAEEQVLQKQLTELTAAAEAADNDVRELHADIAREEQVLKELDSDARREKKAEIAALQEKYDALTRIGLKLRREVDEAENDKRQEELLNRERAAGQQEILNMIIELRANIDALQKDATRLAGERGDRGSALERLTSQAEQMRLQLKERTESVAAAMEERAVLEAEAAQREALLRAEIDASRVELHSAESDRRQFSNRLRDAQQKIAHLRARHDTMIAGIASCVNAELAEAAEAELGLARGSVRAVAEHALVVKPEDMDELTPEALRARCLLARATERQALLDRGNALDDAIVRLQKGLVTVDQALGMLHSASDGTLQVADDDADVDAFIASVVSRFAAEDSLAYTEAEVISWSTHIDELTQQLADERRRLSDVREALEAARQRKADATSLLRQCERTLQQLSSVTVQERLRSERLRSVVRVTQESVLSNPDATARIVMRREREKIELAERALCDLVRRAARRHPDITVAYQRISSLFGVRSDLGKDVLVPVLTEVVPKQQRGSSAIAAQRPATAALVAAMSQRAAVMSQCRRESSHHDAGRQCFSGGRPTSALRKDRPATHVDRGLHITGRSASSTSNRASSREGAL